MARKTAEEELELALKLEKEAKKRIAEAKKKVKEKEEKQAIAMTKKIMKQYGTTDIEELELKIINNFLNSYGVENEKELESRLSSEKKEIVKDSENRGETVENESHLPRFTRFK